MKKKYHIIIALLFLAFNTWGQTYLQGQSVIPFSEAASSKYLSPTKRLSMEQSYDKLKLVEPNPFPKGPEGMTGEFWWVDGMLVQILTAYTTSYKDTLSLYAEMYSGRPATIGGSTLNGVKQPVDTRRLDDNFDEIKSVNGFDVLIQYLRTLSHMKKFQIRDRDRRYIILGRIYAKQADFEQAHVFIDTLLSSIRFKE